MRKLKYQNVRNCTNCRPRLIKKFFSGTIRYGYIVITDMTGEMSMIELIATDIDGTLVKDGSPTLDPAYFEVIAKLVGHGIKFCACSGRQFSSIYRMFEPVADKIYFICENGTVLRTRDRILKEWEIDEDKVDGLIHDLRAVPGSSIVCCTPDVTYTECGEDNDPYKFLKFSYHYEVENVPDLTKLPKKDIVKVTMYHPENAEKAAHDFLRSHWKDDLQVASSGRMWIDCNSKDAGKGEAFALLQEYLDIPKEDTLYFGDNMNDLTAFKEAGTAATVANARKEVKGEASLIEKPYWELGVLDALKRVLQEVSDTEGGD